MNHLIQYLYRLIRQKALTENLTVGEWASAWSNLASNSSQKGQIASDFNQIREMRNEDFVYSNHTPLIKERKEQQS